MKKGYFLAAIVLPVLLLGSCGSIQRKAVRSVSDMLAGSGGASAFTSDDDPQLIADALPLALKLYEILMDLDPENSDLVAATGQNFVLYSAAFVQMPADMADDADWEETARARRRAKKLFRRGRDYSLDALEMRHEGFLEALNSGEYDSASAMLDEADAVVAYWASAGWLAMASTDPFDFDLGSGLDKAALLLFRSLELNPTLAGIHGLMIQMHLSVPSSILVNLRERSPATAAFMDDFYETAGIDEDPMNRALFHYYRALSLSDGADPSPHITMATTVSVKSQDVQQFRDYLGKALEVDPEAHPEDTLMIVIYQEKARWLLDHIEDYFLVDFE